MTIHEHEDLLRAARAQANPQLKRDYPTRSNVERTVAQAATQHGHCLRDGADRATVRPCGLVMLDYRQVVRYAGRRSHEGDKGKAPCANRRPSGVRHVWG